MCGIAGLFLRAPAGADLAGQARAMTDRLVHRGPDGAGQWSDPEAGIALGHRRLSVIDLSPAGAQPMVAASGRHVIVFNGEIYNHPALRARLEAEGHMGWRGASDTETLLAAIGAWGLAAALQAAQGMFALALWDREARVLALARDRVGEKPLYVARLPGGIGFASEIKALHAAPGFDATIDHGAVAAMLRLGYVPEGQAIYRGVTKVPPGTILRFDATGAEASAQPYWTLSDTIHAARQGTRQVTAPADFATLSRATETVLADVVASQMLSDVPLGAFLSGGIDSSLVTALMQRASSRPVRSYSIGFAEARFDESGHAAAVAAHLGTDHTAFAVTEAEALALIPDLPAIYDEPFADSSQIPTTLLCRLARADVTVALTGDGGDEVFGGYNRHVRGPRLWRRLRHVPGPLRRRAGGAAAALHRMGGAEGAALRVALRWAGLPVSAVDKLAAMGDAVAGARDLAGFYDGLVSVNADPGRYVIGGEGPRAPRPRDAGLTDAEWMMVMDTLGYLPGDILVKVDRAAMSASLETRAPFLDAGVIAQSWALPQEARIADGRGKHILRDILARHVPPALTERPKQGFSIPLDRWLRGALRDWAEAMLAPEALARTGLLHPGPVRALWAAHLAGRGNHGPKLWSMLMLQCWAGAQR